VTKPFRLRIADCGLRIEEKQSGKTSPVLSFPNPKSEIRNPKFQPGFTLIELMVAMTIFLFLGIALITMLRGGIRAWHRGEEQRELYEIAQTVLNQIREDLEATYTAPPGDSAVQTKSLFLADFDSLDRPRLRLVRTLSDSAQGFAGAYAGDFIRDDEAEFIDLFNDQEEAIYGDLKPTGGLCEVAYVMGEDGEAESIYRGICSPPHDSFRSLFIDANVDWSSNSFGCRFFADRVLYLGFELWTQYTNRWQRFPENTHYPRNQPPQDIDNPDPSGPLVYWDSTRGILLPEDGYDPESPESDEFVMHLGTPYDPTDDVFPTKVRVTLVLREKTGDRKTRLTRSIDGGAELIRVSHAEPFARVEPKYIMIEDEWIRIVGLEHGNIRVAPEGRGARNTTPESHSKGAVVQAGRSFRLIVNLPSGREDWRD
jgi:prepilin-type N-terminal cleavage/methylation domain-containing protein